MVDEPIPVERTGADPVTPEAFIARVDEFFAGIDLTISGKYKNGLLDISVREVPPFPGAQINAMRANAEINGISIAEWEKIQLRDEWISWSLRGRDDRRRHLIMSYPSGRKDRVLIQRTLFSDWLEEVTDPAERVEVAQILGVKV